MKNASNVHNMWGAHHQYMNNDYGKFEHKGMKTVGVTDYTKQIPPTYFGWKKNGKNMSKSKTRKNEIIFIKCAQNRRGISSICEQQLCKFWIKSNENFWGYKWHELGTQKCCEQTDSRTDGRTDGRTDRRTDGVDPLLDLHSLKGRR